MGRRRKKVYKSKAEESDYDSDDERAYKKDPAPDPSAKDFYMDEVDEFNENQDKILLERDIRMDGDSDSDNQEEILPLDYSDSDSDDDIRQKLRRIQTQQHLHEIASDIEEDGEDKGKEEGLPDAKAWGKRKKEYYNTDYVDDDMPGASGFEEEGAQEEEEREALAIQKRMSQMMQDTDFDLQLFQVSAKTQEKKDGDFDEEAEEKVVKDLSKLSKREKMEILKKESPEFLELVGDFKIRLREVMDILWPLLGMVKDGRIPQGPGADYINTKYKLCMNYCVNISFYMMLKAKHVPVHNHPVIGRILAHKKLIKELEPLDRKLEAEIKELLSTRLKAAVSGSAEQAVASPSLYGSSDLVDSDDNEETALAQAPKSNVAAKRIKKSKKKPALKEGLANAPSQSGTGGKTTKRHHGGKPGNSHDPEMTSDELKALEYYEKMAKEVQERKLEKRKQLTEISQDQGQDEQGQGQEDEAEDGKRAITYQIFKNKGLTPRRKKEARNPRVKNKMKFKKAKVRRKGQVREVRKELTRYGGEISGIRAGVIKSVKIK